MDYFLGGSLFGSLAIFQESWSIGKDCYLVWPLGKDCSILFSLAVRKGLFHSI